MQPVKKGLIFRGFLFMQGRLSLFPKDFGFRFFLSHHH